MTDLDALRKVALAADAVWSNEREYEERQRVFDATFDPPTVLALLAVVEAARLYRNAVGPYGFKTGSELGEKLDAALATLEALDE